MSLLFLSSSDWFEFFGRFHPLIVHLPIGFLLIAGLLELLQILGKIHLEQGVNRAILLFSAITATLACVAGYMLSLSGGYDEHILDEHFWQGIWVAVLAWVAWLAKSDFLTDRIPMTSLLYTPAVVFSILMVFVAGHHGGALTHGSDYLSASTPEPFRAWLSIPPKAETASLEAAPKIADINNAVVFNDIIHPILKGRCEACHNAQKSKGDLRMDTQELLLKGGEDGLILVAGNADASEMIKRMLLPDDDDKHMPPTGKPQLKPEQIKLLKWWIASGASFSKKVSEISLSEDLKPILASLGTGALTATAIASTTKDSLPKQEVLTVKFTIEDELLKQKIEAVSSKTIDDLKQTGALILPVSASSNFMEINFVNNSKATDNEGIKIKNLGDNIVWIKMGGTQISDKTLVEIAKLKNVTRLALENTKITDAGLRAIKAMPNLEYLNLVGTAVTDAGVKELAAMKSLKKLYLWQTKTSPTISLLNVQIDHGLDAKAMADFTNTAQSTRTAKEPYAK
jgi:uncharacterized membrane protein